MVLQHNLAAMFTDKQLGVTTKSQAKSAEKLSTGYKINRAADDAAGLTISENMRRQIRGLNKGSKNAQDGISFCQVADGAIGEMQDIIHRVKELCIQGGNDTNTDADREAIQKEIDSLVNEIGSITDYTEFNTLDVFGKDRELTITKEYADGTKEITTTTSTITGNGYGLGEILGTSSMSSGSTMSEIFSIPGTDSSSWETTGSETTANATYKNDRRDELQTMLGFQNLGYKFVKNQNGVTTNGTVCTVDYPVNQPPAVATITLSYKQLAQGGYVLESATYRNLATNQVTDYGSLVSGKGSQPFLDTKYDSSWIDFKEANGYPGYQVTDLYNQGFSIGSAGTSGYYSIMFTNGQDGDSYQSTGNPATSYSFSEASSKLLKIDISDCINQDAPQAGELIAQKIMAAVAASGLDSDYVQFAHKTTQPDNTKIYILDNRGVDSKDGSFETISRGPNGEQISASEVTRTEFEKDANGNIISTTTYSYKDKDMWIQSGDLEGSGMQIKKAWLTRANIGLDRVLVNNYENASAGIGICDQALAKVSDARSSMGAYVNRMEHIVAVNDNTSENVQSSESKIRDTDMADEMVEYSRANILAQAGQSMLAQANQSTQGILQLLQ